MNSHAVVGAPHAVVASQRFDVKPEMGGDPMTSTTMTMMTTTTTDFRHMFAASDYYDNRLDRMNQHYVGVATPSPEPLPLGFAAKSSSSVSGGSCHSSSDSSSPPTSTIGGGGHFYASPPPPPRQQSPPPPPSEHSPTAAASTSPADKKKRFPCPECGKLFGRVSHVRRHQLLHTGDKPFECDVCGDRFTRLENRDRHMIMHTKVRPYNCELCGKGFTQLNRLKVHRLTHTGERPFTCAVCAKRFLRVDHLRVHMRTHRAGGGGEIGPVQMQVRPGERYSSDTGAGAEHRPQHPQMMMMIGRPLTPPVEKTAAAVDAAAPPERSEEAEQEDGGELDYSTLASAGRHAAPQVPTVVLVDLDEDEDDDDDDDVYAEVADDAADDDARAEQRDAAEAAIDYSPSHRGSSTKAAAFAAAADRSNGSTAVDPAGDQPAAAAPKPFRCAECPKQFVRRDHFQRHVAVHSGERPFQCDLCPKRFSRKDNKYSHMVGCLLKNYGVSVVDGGAGADGGELPRGTMQRAMDERIRAVLGDAYIEPETQLLEMEAQVEDSGDGYDETVAAERRSRRYELEHDDDDEVDEGAGGFGATFDDSGYAEEALALIKTRETPQPAAARLVLKVRDMNELRLPLNLERQSAASLQQHHQHEQQQQHEQQHRCEPCDLHFASRGSLNRHEQLHLHERTFACAVCARTFSRREHLQRHQNAVHPPSPTPAAMDDDGGNDELQLEPIELTVASSSAAATAAAETETETTPALPPAAAAAQARPNRCDVCDKTFQNKSHLVRHAALHSAERPFACDQCDRTFSRKEHLQRHVIVHTGIKPFRCGFCERSFVEQNQQRRHVLEEHAAEAAAAALANPVLQPAVQQHYQQEGCAGDEEGVEGGEIMMDSGIARIAADGHYHCDRCPKSYAHKFRLRRHYAGHTGDKPYQCDFCAQRFARAEHKRRHMAIHTNERRHECEFCERRFVRADHMLAHVKTHEGVLPYKCTVCTLRFASAKQKQEHMRRHTGAYRCEMCLERFESFGDLSEHRRDIHLQTETQRTQILVGRREHYPCPVCKTYYSIVRLGDHLKTHVLADDDEELAGGGGQDEELLQQQQLDDGELMAQQRRGGMAPMAGAMMGAGSCGGRAGMMVWADGTAISRYEKRVRPVDGECGAIAGAEEEYVEVRMPAWTSPPPPGDRRQLKQECCEVGGSEQY